MRGDKIRRKLGPHSYHSHQLNSAHSRDAATMNHPGPRLSLSIHTPPACPQSPTMQLLHYSPTSYTPILSAAPRQRGFLRFSAPRRKRRRGAPSSSLAANAVVVRHWTLSLTPHFPVLMCLAFLPS
jgi:hypothetical protein